MYCLIHWRDESVPVALLMIHATYLQHHGFKSDMYEVNFIPYYLGDKSMSGTAGIAAVQKHTQK